MIPTPKVAAGAYGAATSIVIVFVLAQFGIILPTEVAQAVTLLLGFLASWFRKDPTNVGRHAAV